MWLKELKIAIIEKNIDKLNSLMENLPKLQTKEEIDSALTLLQVATNLVQDLKDKTEASMIQMQKNITFLKATEPPRPSKLDVNS